MSVTREVMELEAPGLLRRLTRIDWGWAVLVVGATLYTLIAFGARMDGYQIGTLIVSAAGGTWLGRFWKPFRTYAVIVALLSLFGLWRYGGELASADGDFFLKYLVSGQSAVMWMCALFFMSTAAYFAGLFARSDFTLRVGSALTWSAATFGLAGLFVRWRETYLTNPEWGYIPVSNLYEVFVLFCVITGLMYLYYEGRTRNRAMGGFAMLVVSAAVGFLLWYVFDRGAHEIRPLVPALQSWWMKIHVPTNFVGYGGFAIAAMLGVAQLLRNRAERVKPQGLLATRLPSSVVLDDLMYKLIAVGFAFFTIATVLGAMWAAEAWGGYWSWDPKETWALIVWLNYAAWLHMRFSKGWRGAPMAWWAVIGLFITTFAFLGVNMFLSGLHSYGEL
ncbi:MAG: c-type cytochrome biogenesis protein CcsB [Chromatiales bacterium]|nr:c-type cytochrome biogenesis protein CcsB [Chromatiales bacterium]